MKERKEQLLTLMKDPSYVPMKLKELAILLDVPKERREELAEVLDVLVAEGKIQDSGSFCVGRNILRNGQRIWLCVN